jgi:hypothetical protein
MIPDWDSSIYFQLMFSLDSAFEARQKLSEDCPNDWGERFFAALDRDFAEMSDARTAVYMRASEILHYFAMKSLGRDFGLSLYYKPEAFLRTVIMVLHHNPSGSSVKTP